MARPGFRSQLSTLIDRTILVQLGSPGTLLLMLVQPVLVGAVLGLGWQQSEATPSTYLCMAIAALYIGAMNAATSIVSERPIFERERMFNLNIASYLLAKTVVLGVIASAQMVVLLVVQSQFMHLPPGLGRHLLLFMGLMLPALTATGLGLCISAFAHSSTMAVLLVPVLIIPQIVFTEVVLGQTGIEKHIPSIVEKFTITKWGFEALEMVGNDGSFTILAGSGSMLLGQLAVLLGLAALKLRLDT